MDRFARTFNTDILKKNYSLPVVSDLFERWALPGEARGETSLRLAVRNGYLNLYRAGQSVAKVATTSDGRVTVELHRKYLDGHMKAPRSVEQELSAKDKKEMNRPRKADLTASSDRVEAWIKTASSYCGNEKIFVDDLVASNPGVIDLEMGLPAHDDLRNEDGELFAPRIDLVVARPVEAAVYVNFWEAKCADNSSLRAKKNIGVDAQGHHVGADVARQLGNYRKWFAIADYEKDVAYAYKDAARVLLELARIAGKDTKSPACQIWANLATSEPLVVPHPGIVVGNYHPQPKVGDSVDHIAAMAASFEVHRERLANTGFTVVEVASARDPATVLPLLRRK